MIAFNVSFFGAYTIFFLSLTITDKTHGKEQTNKQTNGKWNVSIYKRFHSADFTNFEDQDMIVKKDNEVKFTIRFVYASNAKNYDGRCKSIKKWFFQCLQTLEDILISTSKEESERKLEIYSSKKYEGRRSSDSLRGHHIDADNDKSQKKNIPDSNRNIHSNYPKEKTVLYFNSGLWDWRTGLRPKEYFINLKMALYRAKASFKVYDNVIWRTTSASWPSKFMTEAECKKKGKKDKRPCSVHTGEIYQMNELSTPLMKKQGFRIIPSWHVTSTRPDLSYDGLHFRDGSKCKKSSGKTKKNDKKKLFSCHKYNTNDKYTKVNQVLNNFLFNELCL